MSDRYAVMGNPIDHSLSPFIHEQFGLQTGCSLTYDKMLVKASDFEQEVRQFFNAGGKGLNITQPYKQHAYALSDVKTPRCQWAGAANTLWMQEGRLHADNTDGIGLLRDLARHIKLKNTRILVLGAGGAARGILGPLLDTKPDELVLSNRTLEKAQVLSLNFLNITVTPLTQLNKTFDLIINATSASLQAAHLPLSNSLLKKTTICYDLAYQKTGQTPFVTWAKTHGCVGVDGVGMLVEQAAEAFFIWHGVMPDTLPVLNTILKNPRDMAWRIVRRSR